MHLNQLKEYHIMATAKLSKQEQVVVSKHTEKQVKAHLRSIKGSGAKQAASATQSFQLPAIEQGKVPAAPPAVSTDQAAGIVFGEQLVKCAQSADGSFADYVRQMVGKSADFLTACEGTITKALRHEREAVDQERDKRIAVCESVVDATPQAVRKSKQEIMNWASRRKSSLANGRLVQVKAIIAALTSSRTDITYDWKGCKSFSDYLTEAKRAKAGRAKFVALTASGFKAWSGKMSRVVDVGNYEPDSDKSAEQIARLEKMVQQAMTTYLKVAEKIPTLKLKAEVIEKALVSMLK
jgi:hypothetical protein